MTPAAKTDVVLLVETGATMGATGETRRALAVPARATVGGAERATVEALAPTVEFAGPGKEGKIAGLADHFSHPFLGTCKVHLFLDLGYLEGTPFQGGI